MRKSPNFDPNFFLKWIDHNWSEGPRFDCKYWWKDCLVSDERQGDLARHLIAFGNLAYRTGKPCYILYGVKEENRRLINLEGVFPDSRKIPKAAKEPDGSIATIMEDGVRAPILNTMKNWIEPVVPDIELEYGDVEDEYGNNVLVAWLQILPTNVSRPFFLKKGYVKIDDKNRRRAEYRKGQVFIRKGSSSVKLAPSEEVNLRPNREMVYLTGIDWKKLIFELLGEDYSKAANFTPYIEPRLGLIEDEVIGAMVSSINSDKKSIVLLGKVGTGKSLLMRRLAFKMAEQYQQLLDGVPEAQRPTFGANFIGEYDENYEVHDLKELETTPEVRIPIFFHLRRNFESSDEFEQELGKYISALLGWRESYNLQSYFNIVGSKWVLLLDGLDELHKPEDRAQILESWIQSLPTNVQVVVSSRPFINVESFRVFYEIQPLSDDEIKVLVKQKLEIGMEPFFNSPKNLILKEEFIETVLLWMNQNKDVYGVQRFHRAIDAFVTYVVDAAPRFVAQMDRETVRILKTISFENLVSEESFISELPIVTSDDLLSDEKVILKKGKYLDGEPEEDFKGFSLGMVLRTITERLRQAEVDRRVYRSVAQRIDDQSRRQLERAAWFSDWNDVQIDTEILETEGILSETSLEWNENLDLLIRKGYRHYLFLCSLYQHYLAAEYSCHLAIKDGKLTKRDKSAEQVRGLHRELREADGKTSLV